MRRQFIVFAVTIQTILFLAHGLVGATAAAFLELRESWALRLLAGILGLLSLTFVPATLLAFGSVRAPAKGLYRLSAIWLGVLNYLFFGALLAWLLEGLNRLGGEPFSRPAIGAGVLALALLLCAAAFLNAGFLRIKRLAVELPNLPASWKGRRIAVVSDVHLGHVRGAGFLSRIVDRIAREQPDLVLVPGDLYDGTAVDSERLAAPWKVLSAPQGVFFITGNHEEFRDSARFIGPLTSAGVRVLANEKVLVDGLQLVGLHDGDHRDPERLRAILERVGLDRSRASLLLVHSPIHLGIAEQAGISLQISGHTHGGQFLPWTWVVSWIYGVYASGLHALGRMQVLTTCGAGTWGPPMRLGTNPEIVLLELS